MRAFSPPAGPLFFALLALVLINLASPARPAQACGCFAPPDVSQPLVQAGEEIVFAVDGGQVIMYVKIRYSGRAGEFGWLLPLPSVPTNAQGMPGIDVGPDELFTQLESRTQPTYLLQRTPCFRGSSGPSIGCGAADLANAEFSPTDMSALPKSPLIKESTVGPYDFAILQGDDKNRMLQWLATNRYVVPAGTDTAINAYVRPGAYFLALRLRAGASTGDLQPVVLRYPADLPMVPIILTSVGATPNMGVLIWVLGSFRAIPRNYAHSIINDAQLDWLNQVKNYNDVITRAVSEAPGRHAFVTEYAGKSARLMRDVLDTTGRFANLPGLMSQRDPVAFVQQLLPTLEEDFPDVAFAPTQSRVTKGFALNGQFFAVVGAHIPMPQQLIDEGVTLPDYYQRIDFYLRQDRARRPSAYADIEARLTAFDPVALVADLNTRIAEPTLRAGALFSTMGSVFPALTRLYTTLSPEDMTSDPVFSFNAELPEVSNIHRGNLNLSCEDSGGGTLYTSGGFTRTFTQAEIGQNAYTPIAAPWSQRIETLQDTGSPQVLTDNKQAIMNALGQEMETEKGGCATSVPRRSSSAAYLSLCGLLIAGLLLRRRSVYAR